MIQVRVAEKTEFDKISDFYRQQDYGGPLNSTDTVIIAENEFDILGAVRLCNEGGYLLLRGMRIHSEIRRSGLGTRLLKEVRQMIKDQECYCIAHRYLRQFYGQIGFYEMDPLESPHFLQERIKEYIAMGLDVIIMHKSGTLFEG